MDVRDFEHTLDYVLRGYNVRRQLLGPFRFLSAER
jgi:hypothetical protein